MHAAAAATVHSAAPTVHAAASAVHSPAAAAHPPASATGPHLSDEAVVHVGCDAWRSEDFKGLSLRQSETEKRNAKKHVSGQTRPTHGFLPVIMGDLFADWKFHCPHETAARPDRDTLNQPRRLSNSRTRVAQ
jgi:hypothetical protein